LLLAPRPSAFAALRTPLILPAEAVLKRPPPGAVWERLILVEVLPRHALVNMREGESTRSTHVRLLAARHVKARDSPIVPFDGDRRGVSSSRIYLSKRPKRDISGMRAVLDEPC